MIEIQDAVTFEIEFSGKKTFDTLEDAVAFKHLLGDKYLRTYKCNYPDMTFYIVEYREEN